MTCCVTRNNLTSDQIRTATITRGAMFRLPQYMDSSAAVIFRELYDEDCLRCAGPRRVRRETSLL